MLQECRQYVRAALRTLQAPWGKWSSPPGICKGCPALHDDHAMLAAEIVMLTVQDAMAAVPSSFLPPYPHRHSLEATPPSASASAAGSPTEPASQVQLQDSKIFWSRLKDIGSSSYKIWSRYLKCKGNRSHRILHLDLSLRTGVCPVLHCIAPKWNLSVTPHCIRHIQGLCTCLLCHNFRADRGCNRQSFWRLER